jgi:hypothetical protein
VNGRSPILKKIDRRRHPAVALGSALGLGFMASTASCETSQEAWHELVGAKQIHRAAYHFVENDPALPNVLIYGDSISIGYTSGVRKALKGEANVYRLHCNGGASTSFVSKVETLHSVMRDPALEGHWAFSWDVIHFNVGLHDLKFVSDKGKLDKAKGSRVTAPVDYRIQLEQILAFLDATAPEARLIFALTTPVPENERGRFAGDAAHYNQIALDVLKNHPDVVTNDLHTLSIPYLKDGNVHYQGTGGIEAQATRVADVIRNQLGPGRTRPGAPPSSRPADHEPRVDRNP